MTDEIEGSQKGATSESYPRPVELHVEYECKPNNVGTMSPRFSWRATTDERGRRQSAYRILVSRTADRLADDVGDVWDSGRVASSRNQVRYDGLPLAADETYHWKVRIWHEDGPSTAFSAPATFSTALAEASEWEGDWIGHQPGFGDSNGYRSQWHASGDDTDEWVQVDLGETRELDTVELHPASPFNGPTTPDGTVITPLASESQTKGHPITERGPSGFGFPDRFRIEVSSTPSFEESTVLVDRTDSDNENPGSNARSFNIAATARYVRVTATDLYEFDPAGDEDRYHQRRPELMREEQRPWQVFALAALAVRDKDSTDLAAGKPVTASSSIEQDDWHRAHLVDGKYESTVAASSPLLRQEVTLRKPVARARAHVATLGWGELHINGERVGDEVLNPAWTQYDQRVLYSTYDVTELLHEGDNALGIWLGRGWFSKNDYDWTGFGSPRALLQLSIEYVDGTTRTVSTDSSWRASASPIVTNDIYDGETYDARREQDDWATPNFDDDHWATAAKLSGPGGDLHPQRIQPVREVTRLEPNVLWETDDGYIVDFEQNITGYVSLALAAPEAGQRVELAYAEALTEDGTLSMEDLRSADATDTYVARGNDKETYNPRFTYHGFRYLRVSGVAHSTSKVTAEVIHTDMSQRGTFECSNEDLEAIQHAAAWSLRSNSVGLPTGCAQRDERTGWTGDAHLSARALLYNFDAVRFHEKWMRDHDDAQSRHGYLSDTVPFVHGTRPGGPSWTITRIVIPWYLYQFTGDDQHLECHYENMRRYVEYWHSVADDHVIPAERSNYGDWLAFENLGENSVVGLPLELFSTASHYLTTRLLGQIASLLGVDADAHRYQNRATAIRKAFNDRFFNADTHTYDPSTQAAQAVPLHLGLVPEGAEQTVADALATQIREEDDGLLRTGFLGTRALIHALAEHGHADLAYDIVTQSEQPGWVYMVRNDATTLWERWDSDEQVGSGMNSFNHHQFAYVSEWFFSTLAGLKINANDIPHDSIAVEPAIVADLDWVSASIEVPQGTVASRWERTADGLELTVAIPWNTTGRVRIPSGDGTTIRENGNTIWSGDSGNDEFPSGVEAVRHEDDSVVVKVGSGTYSFTTME